ncbi:MAG TPA: hypothetical protein VGZ73_04195 [Bryobacteraceae bacterium]|nr:hypothetical protein [Bryobacteraceae bacterium]
MHKVISERPKSGRTWESKTPRTKPVVMDLLGDQMDEDSNYIRQERQKHRKGRFNVLERFLVNRVGRAWDKVYAEVCSVADSRSFHGAEVRDYLKTCVATECWLEGRTVMSHDWSGCPQVVQGLYVHPKSRLLFRKK